MARGGTRQGAGRRKGSVAPKTKALREAAERAVAAAAAEGSSPLEYMLAIMRDEKADAKRRDAMAVAAAPFFHPRLSAIDGDLNLHLHKHEEALADLE